MNRFEHLRWLGNLLSPEYLQNRELISKLKGKVNWEILVQVASSQLVFPTLFLRFNNCALKDNIPEELLEYCHHIYRLNRERNRDILKQATEVNRWLREKDIEPVFLKGTAALFDRVYEDEGERMIGDIDLLVPEKQWMKAVQILKDAGYREHSAFVQEQLINCKHYPRLTHDNWIAAVEVHRQPVADKYLSFLNNTRIYLHKKVSDTDPAVFVPNDQDKLLLNFFHSLTTVRPFYYGNIFLRDLYEFSLIQRRNTPMMPVLNRRLQYLFKLNSHVASYLINNKKHGFRARIFLFRLRMNYTSAPWRFFDLFGKVCFQRIKVYYAIMRLAFRNRDYQNELKNKFLQPGWFNSKIKNTGKLISRFFLKQA